jgi:hypothetical protein
MFLGQADEPIEDHLDPGQVELAGFQGGGSRGPVYQTKRQLHLVLSGNAGQGQCHRDLIGGKLAHQPRATSGRTTASQLGRGG